MNFSELIVEETTQWREEHLTAAVERSSSNSLNISLKEWPRLSLTARIKRPQLHRGGSASKKGTWPLPPHPSEAARCASRNIGVRKHFLNGR